jgi:CRP-like cAMP-binding protein
MAHWQRRLTREIADLKGRSPAQRVGLFLLARSQRADNSVRLPLTMAELASRIGITPESLSRVMARLRPLGVISNRSEMVINDADALRRFCHGDP